MGGGETDGWKQKKMTPQEWTAGRRKLLNLLNTYAVCGKPCLQTGDQGVKGGQGFHAIKWWRWVIRNLRRKPEKIAQLKKSNTNSCGFRQ